ncbi:MAG: FAD-dependent oxidoreductase [Verrucomicrobia bacterium]|nr:FAD-dependent oxidoreductase [Verrucomicrobiota bacterium]
MVVVIGAGLAGLACARSLQHAGRDVLVLEANPEVGGRVRHERIGGFTCDLGFQVIMDSYTSLRAHVDFAALRPRYFDSGAVMWDAGKLFHLHNPLKHPSSTGTTFGSTAFTWLDKIRLTRMVADLLLAPDIDPTTLIDAGETTWDFLKKRGISAQAVRRFFQPFFGGVFLDDTLSAPASLFLFYLKKFSSGRAFVPAGGIGALPEQMASRLPPGALRLDSPVVHLDIRDRRTANIMLSGNRIIHATQVVIATDEPATRRLLQDATPSREHTSTRVVYFSSRKSLYPDRLIVLPAGQDRLVRHFAQITNVAPEYAPDGMHLVSATILHDRGFSPEEIVTRARAEIAEVFPGTADALRFLHQRHIAYATLKSGTPPSSPWPNVHLAGDQISTSSIDAAIRSGENAARRVLENI